MVAINASWGLGLAVVGGEVTPDDYLVSKVTGEIVKQTINDKAVAVRPGPTMARERSTSTRTRRNAACLDDGGSARWSTSAKRIEQPLRHAPGHRVGLRPGRRALHPPISSRSPAWPKPRRRALPASAMSMIFNKFGAGSLMPLTDDDVREILRIIDESDLDELSIETDGFSLHVRKGGAAGPGPRMPGTRAHARNQCFSNSSRARARDPGRRDCSQSAESDGLETIPSPMLGTFYRAEAPGAAPFVEVGATVEPETTVCIIEVMKMMNSVPAGVSGHDRRDRPGERAARRVRRAAVPRHAVEDEARLHPQPGRDRRPHRQRLSRPRARVRGRGVGARHATGWRRAWPTASVCIGPDRRARATCAIDLVVHAALSTALRRDPPRLRVPLREPRAGRRARASTA